MLVWVEAVILDKIMYCMKLKREEMDFNKADSDIIEF